MQDIVINGESERVIPDSGKNFTRNAYIFRFLQQNKI